MTPHSGLRVAVPPPGTGMDAEGFEYSPISDEDISSSGAGKGLVVANSNKSSSARYFDDGKWRRDCSRGIHRWRYAIWFLSLFAFYILYVLIFNIGWTGYGAWWFYSDKQYPKDASDSSAKTVMLIGDSLLNRPFQRFGSAGMLQRRLSDYPLVFWNEAQDGSQIASSYSRLGPALSEHNPQAVVLLWDSDASDVDESVLTADEVTTLRANYMTTLRVFCNTTLSYPSVEYMVMSGPVVYGSEGTLARPERFNDKSDVYDEYREMNKQVASEFGVDYIDARSNFLSAVPFYWQFYKWWVSIDGEHFNYRGTIIWTNLLADRLESWLGGK